MLAKERLVYIINRLQVRPSISVQELSREMNVSLSTVQRDLIKLEKEGRIERSRGGAISHHVSEMLSGESDIAVSEKIHLHQAEKEIIAKNAIKFIKDGECIFLDSGTTIAHLVPYIMNRNITIVTNSMYLQRRLAGCKGQVFLLGGKYSAKLDMTLGASTIMQLENLRFDRAFLSASGVDVRSKELYSVDSEIAVIKKLVMKRSKRTYVLVDNSKFNVKAIYTYAKLNEVDYIFTNQYPENERVLKNIVVCK